MTLTLQEFHLISSYILKNYGIDLSKKKFMVESKLSIEFAKLGLTSFASFWSLLKREENIQLRQAVIDAITTNYSYFYREENHFEFLKNTILKESSSEKGKYPVYIWCAGCAGGQEVYTIAMQMLECQQKGLFHREFSIRGSDVSKKSIEMAQKAVYPLSDYVRLPQKWQKDYCMLVNGKFEIKNDVKKHVHFSQENLMEESRMNLKYRVIFCRNVLIYFDDCGRERLVKRFSNLLQPGGYLIIGHSETIKIHNVPLEYIQPSIYRKSKGDEKL